MSEMSANNFQIPEMGEMSGNFIVGENKMSEMAWSEIKMSEIWYQDGTKTVRNLIQDDEIVSR